MKRITVIAPLLFTLLTACGGGGGTSVAEGGIGGSGMSVGVVNEFGSIVVNGTRFIEDSDTVLTLNGSSAPLGTDSYADHLKLGMVVTVRDHDALTDDATIGSDATALEVEFESLIRGSITVQLPVSGSNIEVMNQSVLVGDATRYFNESGVEVNRTTAEGWDDTHLVEVSGFIANGGNTYVATYIKDEGLAAGAVSKIEGVVSVVGPDRMIGGLKLSGFNSATLVDGTQVRARGTYDSATDTLILSENSESSSIDLSDRVSGDRVEVEGITANVPANPSIGFPYTIQVAGVDVVVTAATEFEKGTVLMLADDIRVEAEGTVDGSGNFVASEIEFEDEQFDFTAATMSYSGANNNFTVFGQTVEYNELTNFIDSTGDVVTVCEAATPANCAGAAIEVEVKGGYTAAGNLLASEIRLRDDAGAVTPEKLEGVVEAIDLATPNAEKVTIAGIEILTLNTPDAAFLDETNTTIGRTAFFNRLIVGDEVKAKGAFTDPEFDATTSMELED